MTGRALVLFGACLLVAGCGDRRKPITMRGDMGPSVVVIGPRPTEKPKAQPALPLIDEQEPDDDLAHAQPMEAGKGIRGTIREPKSVPAKHGGKDVRAVGDEDFYSFVDTVSDGARTDAGIGFRVARVELEGVPELDLSLEVLDGDGKRLWLANDNAEGKGEVISNLVVEPGRTYYVKVRSVTAKAGTQPYSLTVVTAPASPGEEREPNDDVAHATLVGGGDATGYYGKKRDEDWLRLQLAGAVPGSTLRLELSGVEGVAPELRMLSSTGTLVVDARGGRGEELRLRNVGIPAGPFTLTVRAAEGRNVDQRWMLKTSVEGALDGAEHEPNEVPASATPLDAAVGRVSGFLWPSDVDVYHVTGVPPGSLVSASVDGVPRVDLRLERLGSDGRVLMRADEAGADRGETLPPLAGDVYLRVSARARDVAFDTPYTLSVNVVPGADDLEIEPNDSMANATPWPATATSMRGYLAPRGDEDWYRLVAPASASKLTVETTMPAGLSANVRVVDESKAPLGPSLSGGRASGPVQPGKTYWLSVKANTDKLSNPRDPYTVTTKFE